MEKLKIHFFDYQFLIQKLMIQQIVWVQPIIPLL